MDFKKKWNRFWTLNRHHEDGFTLVELIVVIAIMAILAGVGTAGYGAYIKSANKGADRKLVGDVMRAIQTSGNSYMADFTVEGQYSTGLQLPVGYVVLTTEGTTAISNDKTNMPIEKAMIDAFGENYDTMKLKYTEWGTTAVGGSTLHNAAGDMIGTINDIANVMIKFDSYSKYTGIQLGSKKYNNANELIMAVSDSIIKTDKETFVNNWLSASNGAKDQQGFGYRNREDYSAVRMGYNNSFAEYVRANYTGADAETVADGIANYGQTAGDMVADRVGDKWYTGLVSGGVNAVAGGATFPYTANADAFNDPNYPGYNNGEIKQLYQDWLAGPAKADAEVFYDMMNTVANDGQAYIDANGGNNKADFVNWFAGQAQAYSDNINEAQNVVNASESAITVVAYYTGEKMEFEVYAPEADPNYEK